MQKPKPFRPWQPEQTTLLQISPHDWLAEDHKVYFLLVLVNELDLYEALIPAQAKDPRGEKAATVTETSYDAWVSGGLPETPRHDSRRSDLPPLYWSSAYESGWSCSSWGFTTFN